MANGFEMNASNDVDNILPKLGLTFILWLKSCQDIRKRAGEGEKGERGKREEGGILV